jgi:hypothetical protein
MSRRLFIIIKKTTRLKSKHYKEGRGKATERGKSTYFSRSEIKDGKRVAIRPSASRPLLGGTKTRTNN